MLDNGPQFSADLFHQFAEEYGLVSSSPRYPRANEEADQVVRTVKMLLKKNLDPYIALLNYRALPLQNGLSPAELLMGRKLRTQLPALPCVLYKKGGSDRETSKIQVKFTIPAIPPSLTSSRGEYLRVVGIHSDG